MTHSDSKPGESLLEEVFRVHAEGLMGAVRGVLGRGADLEEAIQEAFLRAWRAHLQGFRPRDQTAWVYVVTMNTAKDLRRRRVLRATEPLEEVSPVHYAVTADPSASVEDAERAGRAREAIHRLADHEREVFFMRVNANLTFEAIAQALEIPVGTAKSRMRLALAHLRESIASGDQPSAARNPS